jgi:RimJ/RimL family protein N-acetyltransferase
VQIPVLETELLILREFRGNGFEPMAGVYPDSISPLYGGLYGREATWRDFAMYLEHWSLRGCCPWALEENAAGRFMGMSGLWFSQGWPKPEVTWARMPHHHGKGYATDGAGRELVDLLSAA